MDHISNRFVLFACTKVDCKNYDINISLDNDDCLRITCNECGSTERVILPENSSILKYKHMWNALKTDVEKSLKFHKSGEMQSITESIRGEVIWDSILYKMKQLEKHNPED